MSVWVSKRISRNILNESILTANHINIHSSPTDVHYWLRVPECMFVHVCICLSSFMRMYICLRICPRVCIVFSVGWARANALAPLWVIHKYWLLDSYLSCSSISISAITKCNWRPWPPPCQILPTNKWPREDHSVFQSVFQHPGHYITYL